MAAKEGRDKAKQKEREDQADSALGQYLTEIERYPLLTAAQEWALAQRIADGDAEAYHQLVQANLRLVVSLARRYSPQGRALSDLIQDGNLGLMRAAHTFDPKHGCRFSTYATWWIRQAISRASPEYLYPLHLPVYVVELISKMKRVSSHLCQQLGRDPLDEELAQALHLSKERIIELQSLAEAPSSLESPLDDEEAPHLAETLQDHGATPPAEEVTQQELHNQILQALQTLHQRERQIIELHYGLHNGITHTLEELGAHFQVSKERIRQLEIRALHTLRQPIQILLDHAAEREP